MLETSEMMSVGSPKHGATIMPSSALLWRLKVLLFLLWGFICCKIGVDSVIRMNADLRDLFLYEVFLYYNPLLLVTMMVWLWGINLWVFSQSPANYAKIFNLDHTHLTHSDMCKCATWMTIIVPTSMTAYLYLYSHGEVSLAASQPVLLYTAVFMVLIFPFDIFYLSSRYFFLKTLWRIILPLQVLSDLERSVCRMVHRQVATIAWFEADSVCGSHSVAIPLVLVLPYICRFFQCIRQYKDAKEKTCLFNALKYSTAVPVVFLSALKYHVFPESWCFFRNFQVQSTYHMLKLVIWTSMGVLLGNSLGDIPTVFFRVENEWNKMAMKQGLQVSMSELPTEEAKLLGSTNHNA